MLAARIALAPIANPGADDDQTWRLRGALEVGIGPSGAGGCAAVGAPRRPTRIQRGSRPDRAIPAAAPPGGPTLQPAQTAHFSPGAHSCSFADSTARKTWAATHTPALGPERPLREARCSRSAAGGLPQADGSMTAIAIVVARASAITASSVYSSGPSRRQAVCAEAGSARPSPPSWRPPRCSSVSP